VIESVSCKSNSTISHPEIAPRLNCRFGWKQNNGKKSVEKKNI